MNNLIDATVFFLSRRARREQAAPQPVATFETVLLRDMTLPELIHALRGTGLVVTKTDRYAIIHRLHRSPHADR